MIEKIILSVSISLLAVFIFFFIGKPPQAKEITFGVNFSQKHAQDLKLDWRETYSAILDDLKVRNIKLITQWDLIEPEKEKYNFEDLDWQITEAGKRKAKILLVIGMKTGRWPECHIPDWAKGLDKERQQKSILKLIEEIVLRYKELSAIKYWQVENEPFFPFGECPWIDKNFLKKEINEVKLLDSSKRPVIISDSGEFSFWTAAAKLGDIVGTTLHRKVWFKELNTYISYPFNPTFYWRKSQIIKKIFGKEVIIGELQAEPWCSVLLYDCSTEEQKKTMDLNRFQKNIEFAERTGLGKIYLWGGEWWFWLKDKQNQPEIWNEAKKLF